LTVLSHKRDFKRDMQKVKQLSSKIGNRLHEPGDSKIDRLSQEQLRDLNEILKLADCILTKYEDKRDFHGLLKEFVDVIRNSAESIDEIDSDVDELVLSAEASLSIIRDAQVRVAEKADFDRPRYRTENHQTQV